VPPRMISIARLPLRAALPSMDRARPSRLAHT